MSAIYEPRGAAREYSPLALNTYKGCSHGCTYCYAPSCTRTGPQEFATPRLREVLLPQVARDAGRLTGDPRPILVSFTCDPYQPIEAQAGQTGQALALLIQAGLKARVLTKNPRLALDLNADLFKRGGVEFGSTILFTDDKLRQEWEPNASPVEERIEAIIEAHEMGLQTWVSVEPVIDPDEALRVIDTLYEYVDVWKIGRWNHDDRADLIDWPAFTIDALAALKMYGSSYYIKNELWRSAGDAVEGRAKTNVPADPTEPAKAPSQGTLALQ